VEGSHNGKYRSMWIRPSGFAVPLGALLAVVVGGCADTGAQHAATDTAVRLLTSVRDGNGADACALLAPETAARLESSSGQSCAQAIGDEDLPDPGPVTGVTVDGQWAKVAVTAGDNDGTVFLAMFRGGWRVVAAGCRPRGEQPYDCSLEGG